MAGQREINSMWNLSGEAMVGERGDQADDRARNPNRDRDEIRAGQWRRCGKSVEAAPDRFDFTGIPQRV